MSNSSSSSITIAVPVPAKLSRFVSLSKTYALQVAKEIAQTAVVAGAAAGLTVIANDIPAVSAHYGFGPLFTAQAIALVGVARAFVSGLNNVKATPLAYSFSDPAPAVDQPPSTPPMPA